MKTVAIAGSTGSIGRQAIEVALAEPDRFRITALGVNTSAQALLEQVEQIRPQVMVVADPEAALTIEGHIPVGVELRVGREAMASLVTEADVMVNAVVGFAGLPVTIAALSEGRTLALANKESLVAGGPVVAAVRDTPGAALVPVDSEHGAIHQCLRSETENGAGAYERVNKLVLTASGGPFRGRSAADLAQVTVEDALKHPTWSMGPKITIDSSTLFNKGLEVIEAHELFGIPYDRIEVVVHPQSIVHSAVEFTDGSTIAQMSHPDMRLPIGYAMGYPDRASTPFGALRWSELGALAFEPPDLETFRCLTLAYESGRRGGTVPAWLNAANEVAVDAFLGGGVSWTDISSIIEETLSNHDGARPDSVDAVVAADGAARRCAAGVVGRIRDR